MKLPLFLFLLIAFALTPVCSASEEYSPSDTVSQNLPAQKSRQFASQDPSAQSSRQLVPQNLSSQNSGQFDPNGRASDATSKNPVRLSKQQAVGFTVLSAQYHYRDYAVPYKIAVWYPTEKEGGVLDYKIGPSLIRSRMSADAPVAAGKFPIIFYSHGATGAGTSSFFLCELLAKNGYIVVGPDFLDLVCVARIGESIPFDATMRMRANQYIDWLRQFALNGSIKEEIKLHAYRPAQLRQTIDLMLAENSRKQSPFYSRIDESRLGLVGHSFGAWTSLLVAGASPDSYDERVKAVVALSGPVNDKVFSIYSENDLAKITIPVLFEYGEKEAGQGRMDDRSMLYEKVHAPKGLICIKGADHLTFSGGVKGEFRQASDYLDKDTARRAICESTLAFFEAYLRQNPERLRELKTVDSERTLSIFSD